MGPYGSVSSDVVVPSIGDAVLLQKAPVLSGDYVDWEVLPEHDGLEIWVVADLPRRLWYRNSLETLDCSPVYLREDGCAAGAEYFELLPELRLVRARRPNGP